MTCSASTGDSARESLEIEDVRGDGVSLGGRQAVGQHGRTRGLEAVQELGDPGGHRGSFP
jgi:hypothetical protein